MFMNTATGVKAEEGIFNIPEKIIFSSCFRTLTSAPKPACKLYCSSFSLSFIPSDLMDIAILGDTVSGMWAK